MGKHGKPTYGKAMVSLETEGFTYIHGGFPGFPPHLPMSKAEASPRSPASAKAALTAELP